MGFHNHFDQHVVTENGRGLQQNEQHACSTGAKASKTSSTIWKELASAFEPKTAEEICDGLTARKPLQLSHAFSGKRSGCELDGPSGALQVALAASGDKG